jgi:hypothetical protein
MKWHNAEKIAQSAAIIKANLGYNIVLDLLRFSFKSAATRIQLLLRRK